MRIVFSRVEKRFVVVAGVKWNEDKLVSIKWSEKPQG